MRDIIKKEFDDSVKHNAIGKTIKLGGVIDNKIHFLTQLLGVSENEIITYLIKYSLDKIDFSLIQENAINDVKKVFIPEE